MNWPTAVIGLLVLAVFAAIVARGVYNRRHGKGGCSACGGSCGACNACHTAGQDANGSPHHP